ncbi:mitochondrial import inner membrane translocase, putative [Plasmodium gaboni]|uniref:Mitochondrial import inner membrane translocase, putative n=1 Tax=Plasmodium gaboni TaxID=647221 RepID=A0ABY0KWF3_9APIC|nr:mitochondrial import inner membrane translocase, putative [Plasmodium gaboni]
MEKKRRSLECYRKWILYRRCFSYERRMEISFKKCNVGGVLLAIIEIVSIVLTRKTTPTPRQQFQQQMELEKRMATKNNR